MIFVLVGNYLLSWWYDGELIFVCVEVGIIGGLMVMLGVGMWWEES